MSKQYPGGLITKSPVTPSGPYSNSTASGIWTLDQQAYWQKLGQWPNANNPPLDPQFNYVTMLLHGDGTNGAQNNTFVDSSTNNFTITRNGNTTQGSFSPYGSNWANYFDGTGDRLSIASASALNIGSADMTMEFWMLIPSAFPSNYRVLFAKGTNTSGGNSYAIEGMSSGALTLWVNTDGSDGWNLFSGTTIGTPTVGAWNHVVVCRSGTTWYSFMNGTRVLNTTGAGTVTASSTAVTIGDFGTAGFEYTGYISNLRLVNGTAIYANATTCTVPTAPLTAVTNTSLLTCQSNRFIDNSTNAFAITTTGTPSIQRFNPFGASTAYSTSVIGGSGFFDGTGDYLTSSCGNVGTGDFTIEGWFYFRTTPSTMGLFQASSTSGGFAPNQSANLAVATGSSSTWQIYAKNTYTTSSSTSVPVNAWGHMALVRSGTTTVLYINGAAVITLTSDSTNYSTSYIGLGGIYDNSSYLLNGYLSNFRVVVGTAVYTSAFTPPTAPVTAISGTALLANMTNGAIFDNAMMNDLETVGNAQISTSVVKYGTGSLAFDGTGDYLVNANSINLAFNTGNFTIEGWFNRTSGSNNGLFQLSTTAGGFVDSDVNNLAIGVAPTDLTLYANNSTTTSSTVSITNGTWNHFALVRSGTTTTLYYNGVSVLSLTDSKNYTGTYLVVGGYYTTTYVWNGYIDEFRITKGYARYTANFTPPTAAFFNYGPT